jgi:hypothetical protein
MGQPGFFDVDNRAFQENSLGGKFIRTIGLIRAWAKIGMMNLAYNLRRYAYLKKQTWAQSAP